MRTFPVEDDVVELVWAKAKPAPFEQLTFSEALRRILAQAAVRPVAAPASADPQLVRLAADSGRTLLGSQATQRPQQATRRGRAPKADLRELVRVGLLKDGQELFLVDFRGQRHPDGRAVIVSGDLRTQDGRLHSMSALAGELLKEQGYVAESVRGPDHWVTASGQKVRELWENALKRGVVR